MASFVETTTMLLVGTGWTGTAPGPGNPSVSGTITSTTDFSDHLRSVSVSEKVAMKEMTTFGDGGFVVVKPGLESADVTFEFNQDFGASSIHALLGVATLAKTLYYIDLKPTSSARGSTNPSFVAAGYFSSYPFLTGSPGDDAKTSLPFTVTGTFAHLTS